MDFEKEFSACGVGFVASLENSASHETLRHGLRALKNLEHRGGQSADGETSDGSGIMTDIPHALLDVRPGDAVAQLFLPKDPTARVRALNIFEATFAGQGLHILKYREVPIDRSVLTPALDRYRPEFLMAVISRPEQCHTRYTFEKMLYTAKQLTRGRLGEAGIHKQFFFTSLSSQTIIYKALTSASKLSRLFLDLQDPSFETRFALFHRRFSTNTATAWDTAQPFRTVAHNGEINTISGNLAWALSREQALGLKEDELVTRRGISDSGTVNEMIEALFFRSSIPHPEDILAILVPQAESRSPYYRFWNRAMEPWDGPALFVYSDGRTVGARLDRSGFRPCRWARTETHFFLSSEAGSFEIPEATILEKGSLSGGASLNVTLATGKICTEDASRSRENRHATFDARLVFLERLPPPKEYRTQLDKLSLFGFTEEDIKKVIAPLVNDGKEGMGSMGDTARLAVLSDETRPLFDFFFQRFAQVTNPPLDYLRERIVTDMTAVLGRKPNIFEPKELLPLKPAIELEGPVLSLGQMDFLNGLDAHSAFEGTWPAPVILDCTFPRSEGVAGARARLEELRKEATDAIDHRNSLIVLSDRAASEERLALPAVLALTAVGRELNACGRRLRASLIVDSAEVKEPHHLAVLTALGAAAVCPYLLLELAVEAPARFFAERTRAVTPADRERKTIEALETGLLKIMAKAGISVFRSYHGAKLLSILGFSEEVHKEFFPDHTSFVGGLSFAAIIERLLRDTSETPTSLERGSTGLLHNYLYQEHPRKRAGERHAMTIARTKQVHRMVASAATASEAELAATYAEYLKTGSDTDPISFRHLLQLKAAAHPLDREHVQSSAEILRTFGSGAMSFGAISAEAQRDVILAMRAIGGRSNSGEGGENPYYFTDGISANIKQVASGRFGVTAEYLVNGDEIQIKMAQGAKPGEGGQLMAAKVNADIARARFSDAGVDLISPPPMHDIYSIEDLKQLIYEMRQLKPNGRVSVKLVAGENVGTIAVGVAKAGADVIHISGHDGGTGAATLGSMKHAGLPWELGLIETHRHLVKHGLRHFVTLRVDGGLSTGRDVVTAACLGAEEFDFGKILLVAEGCIMARVCEKNTCPTGIATHDPRFKRLYRGTHERVVALLQLLGEDVAAQLARSGVARLSELVGRTDLLEEDPEHGALIAERALDVSCFLGGAPGTKGTTPPHAASPFIEALSPLNQRILDDVRGAESPQAFTYKLRTQDRAVPATLLGALAAEAIATRRGEPVPPQRLADKIKSSRLHFHGSAGQGFGAFLQSGVSLTLRGEANDSVGKAMSGGQLIVLPAPEATFLPGDNALLGNCALYGATGGMLYAYGVVGDRFAVRNSGATAVVEAAGLHACEYMTRGTVVILGTCGKNVGAGMTGGVLYVRRKWVSQLNPAYLTPVESSLEDVAALRTLLEDYRRETASPRATELLDQWETQWRELVKCVPRRAEVAVAPVAHPPEIPKAVRNLVQEPLQIH